jgi:hypothetical protein
VSHSLTHAAQCTVAPSAMSAALSVHCSLFLCLLLLYAFRAAFLLGGAVAESPVLSRGAVMQHGPRQHLKA